MYSSLFILVAEAFGLFIIFFIINLIWKNKLWFEKFIGSLTVLFYTLAPGLIRTFILLG